MPHPVLSPNIYTHTRCTFSKEAKKDCSFDRKVVYLIIWREKMLKAFSHFACLVPVFLSEKETKWLGYFQNFCPFVRKKTPRSFSKNSGSLRPKLPEFLLKTPYVFFQT
jgi:hypothetical protein